MLKNYFQIIWETWVIMLWSKIKNYTENKHRPYWKFRIFLKVESKNHENKLILQNE